MNTIIVVTELDICAGNTAGSARVINIAKALALSDVRVYITSARNSREMDLNEDDELYTNIYSIGEHNNIRVNNKLIYKILEVCIYASYVYKIHKLSKRLKYKPVIYVYPTTKTSVDFFVLLYLKLIHRYKIYYEVNEVRLFSLTNRSFSKRLLRKTYEIFIYWVDYIKYKLVERSTKHYDGLLAISKNIERYFSVYNKNIIRVPILSDSKTNNVTSENISEFYRGNVFTICFTGMIELKKEGFDILYEAIAVVRNMGNEVELHLYGPINAIDRNLLLTALPEKLGFKDAIYYHGIVDQKQIISEMRKYHLLILPRPMTPQTDSGFSTKLSEYMVSGVPVLVTDVSDNALYIKDNVNGYIIQPGNVEAMAAKINEIICNYEKDTKKIVENALETAKTHFDYSNYSVLLSEFMS